MSGAIHPSHALGAEAVRLLNLLIPRLHLAPNGRGGSRLEIDDASPELIDGLSAFWVEGQDDEDDGTAEPDARGLPRELLDGLLAPVARQGHPVPPWSPPGAEAAGPVATVGEVARHWPDLVKR